jgi:hypothetical protein
VRSAKINVDWPADTEVYGRFGASDHDPEVARFVLPAFGAVEDLADLVRALTAAGQITGGKDKQLLERLGRVAQFRDSGQHRASCTQLETFQSQVRDLSPRFITPQAADALVAEAGVLHARDC